MIKSKAAERLISYAKIWTTSDEKSQTHPSTERQLTLANMLVEEMQAIGISNAHVDEHGYVYGSLAATMGCESARAIGLIAHLDTAAFNGENVKPLVHENYDGGDLILPLENRVIRAADFPQLQAMRGKTVITASGDTLLGADDKAGIAEIMTACEEIISEKMAHGKLCIAFTPDEEVGQGADLFNVQAFGAAFAYTLDGGAVGGVEYENFNAADAKIHIDGVSVHPGSAKGVMVNALLLACEVNNLLPENEIPAQTEGYEGFYHLQEICGDSDKAEMHYILRDHDAAKFDEKRANMQRVVNAVSAKYPTAHVSLEITESYRNMREQIEPCMHLITNAVKATELAGVKPYTTAIRGGTDGARLSFMGLPCPNIGTGGHNFHGPCECIAVQDMDAATQIIKNIVSIYAK